MKRRIEVLAGLSGVLLACLGAAACGDADSGPTTTPTGGSNSGGSAGSGGSGTAGESNTGGAVSTGGGGGEGGAGTGGSPVVLSKPPDPGPTAAADGTGTTVFAIQRLFVGDTDWDGTKNTTDGWKQYGYDVDSKVSTATSTDLCKPRSGATAKNVYPDGPDGLDNSFGKNLVPIFLGINASYSAAINDKIAAGETTLLFALDKLGAADAYNPLIARVYGGAPLGWVPKFDNTDVWPPTAESVTDTNDVESAKLVFDQSYLVDNTFVSRPVGTLVIPKLLMGTDPVTVHEAVVTMQLSADHKTVIKGVISGVLDTAEVTAAVHTAAGRQDTSLCTGPVIDSIIAQFEQASDVLADGTQDREKDCTGISIGLGFTGSLVQLGAVADPASPPSDPCNM